MPRLIFHPDVSYKFRESYLWYQEKAEGLGVNFLDELETAYQAILELPNAWPNHTRGFKRYLLTGFPVSVIYKYANNVVYIVAVMHNSRKPGYWLKRT
jgi:plasmid stabilization system protein ParE